MICTHDGSLNAITTKPHRFIELVRGTELDWQLALSYVYDNQIRAPIYYHTQNYYELIVHLSSGRAFHTRDKLIRAGYGDILLFPPDVPHKGVDIADGPYERYYIFINPKVLAYLPDGDQIAGCFAAGMPPLVQFDPDERDRLLAELQLLRAPCELGPAEQSRVRLMTLEFLYTIWRWMAEPHPCPNPNETDLPLSLHQILKYMDKNYASIGTIREVADTFGISISYMTRLFREGLRTSPYQYLQSIRLSAAKCRLRNGANVTEACFASGFSDCSHFIALFHREIGVTPGEWKKRASGHSEIRLKGNEVVN